MESSSRAEAEKNAPPSQAPPMNKALDPRSKGSTQSSGLRDQQQQQPPPISDAGEAETPKEPMNESDIDYGRLERMTAQADGKGHAMAVGEGGGTKSRSGGADVGHSAESHGGSGIDGACV